MNDVQKPKTPPEDASRLPPGIKKIIERLAEDIAHVKKVTDDIAGALPNIVDPSPRLQAIEEGQQGIATNVTHLVAGVNQIVNTIAKPVPVPPAGNTVLVDDLKKLCTAISGELAPLREAAKRKQRDLVSVENLNTRVQANLDATDADLQGKGGLFLRSEAEKLQTTFALLKKSLLPKGAIAVEVPKQSATPIVKKPMEQKASAA